MTKRVLLILSLPGAGFFAAGVAAEGLPSPGILVVPILIIVLLIALNGLFVMAEFAIIGVRPTRLQELADTGAGTARHVLAVLQSRANQDRYIATAQLGITIASLGLGMYGEPQIAHFVEPYLARWIGGDPSAAVVHIAGSVVGLSLLTYLHVVLGEMVPKSLALAMADKAVLAVAGSMRLMQAVFSIPVRILNAIGVALLHVFRVPPASESVRLHSTEELELIVSESAESGVLNDAEKAIISNIFDFRDRHAHQVMTPRLKVQAIPHDASLTDVLERVTESKFSRFPVYEGDLDHIVGILHVKDLIRQLTSSKGGFDLRLLIRPVPVVPEHYPVERLLAAFRRQRLHMAIVLDEFGGTEGIVTLEDLVEEIVGEVRDEFDLESEPLVELAAGVLEVSGSYLLDDLKSYVDLGPEDDLPDVETVGGLVMAALGRLPQVGDEVSRGNARITVLAIDGLAVARARVEYTEPGRAGRSEAGADPH